MAMVHSFAWAREANKTAEYWGNLAMVAMRFYIQTGNPAELDAAYWYTRYACRVV